MCLDNPNQYSRKLLIIVDRHSAWSPEHNGGRKEGTQGLISALNTHLANFGISTEIAPDRGLERTASATKRSLRDYPPPTSHTPTMY